MNYLCAIFPLLVSVFLICYLQTNIKISVKKRDPSLSATKCDMRFIHVKFLSSQEDNVLVNDIHCKESQIV